MKIDDEPITLSEWLRKMVYKRFGIFGLLFVAFVLSIGFLIANWNDIKTWPVAGPLIERFSRWPIPQADPDRFSVMVAHLENDPNRENERIILESLKEFDGIQLLNLDRTISLEGPIPENKEAEGHEIARDYLKKAEHRF